MEGGRGEDRESFSHTCTSAIGPFSCSEYLFTCIQFFADFLCVVFVVQVCLDSNSKIVGVGREGMVEGGRFHGLDSRVWLIALGEASSARRLMPVLCLVLFLPVFRCCCCCPLGALCFHP